MHAELAKFVFIRIHLKSHPHTSAHYPIVNTCTQLKTLAPSIFLEWRSFYIDIMIDSIV